MKAKQKQQLDTIETEIEALETLVLEKPEEPEALQPPEEPEPLAEPAKPEEPDAPAITSYSFISQIPYGIAIGLAVSILMISLLYILRLPVQLPEQMQRQLGIRYLGGIKKRTQALNIGAKLAGSLRMLEEDKAIELIAANMSEALGKNRKILITGSVPEDAIEDTAR